MIPLLIVLFTWIAIEIDVADVMQRHDGVDQIVLARNGTQGVHRPGPGRPAAAAQYSG
jgi:hypothetical protein